MGDLISKDHILYVDDEPENLRGFKALYNSYYKIHIAQSATEGLQILSNQPIKLILSDQRMPGISGVAFLEKTVEICPDIIRMIVTGYSDISAIVEAINKSKIYSYIAKPWDKDELKIMIDNALASFNLKQENKKLIIDLQKSNSYLEKLNSELLIAKDKAEENDKLKSAFLTNISHEIRTPMNAILGFAELLKEPGISNEEKNNYIDIINSSSKQLLGIINDIIEISKIETKQIKLIKNAANINAIVLSVYKNFKQLATNDNNLQLIYKTDLPDNKAIINTDELKLTQILKNLVENSLKFTEIGYIKFGYKLADYNNLEFFVEDTGTGIKPEFHSIIFERFRQVDMSDTRSKGGSGLGLAISKVYVEMLGGKIWFNSSENKGSTFYFTIPYEQIHDLDLQLNTFE